MQPHVEWEFVQGLRNAAIERNRTSHQGGWLACLCRSVGRQVPNITHARNTDANRTWSYDSAMQGKRWLSALICTVCNTQVCLFRWTDPRELVSPCSGMQGQQTASTLLKLEVNERE
jgi:hypothetical protein